MNRTEKETTVGNLHEKMAKATFAAAVSFQKLDAFTDIELRKSMRAAKVDFKVVKNSLATLAAKGTPVEKLVPHFKGPVAVAIAYGDVVQSAKAVRWRPSTRPREHHAEGRGRRRRCHRRKGRRGALEDARPQRAPRAAARACPSSLPPAIRAGHQRPRGLAGASSPGACGQDRRRPEGGLASRRTGARSMVERPDENQVRRLCRLSLPGAQIRVSRRLAPIPGRSGARQWPT